MYSIQVTSKCCNTKYIYFILMIIYTHKMTPVAQHHLISRVQLHIFAIIVAFLATVLLFLLLINLIHQF